MVLYLTLLLTNIHRQIFRVILSVMHMGLLFGDIFDFQIMHCWGR